MGDAPLSSGGEAERGCNRAAGPYLPNCLPLARALSLSLYVPEFLSFLGSRTNTRECMRIRLFRAGKDDGETVLGLVSTVLGEEHKYTRLQFSLRRSFSGSSFGRSDNFLKVELLITVNIVFKVIFV